VKQSLVALLLLLLLLLLVAAGGCPMPLPPIAQPATQPATLQSHQAKGAGS